MQTNANVSAVTAYDASSTAPAAIDVNETQNRQDTDQVARYRLVIEEGPRTGSFIYKTMDRVTGEVVKQFPREQVVDMMNKPDYSAGAVIDTRA
ncbi:flagellar protein FlaG [Brevundimonas sp. FT23042]|uniref:flagellar protein FlaG n=1 Tax=Brevundimonas sp. FT23042 TaxID=3393749 RepID=UPI003B58A9E7